MPLIQDRTWPMLAGPVLPGERVRCRFCDSQIWAGNLVFMNRRTRDMACTACVVNRGVLLHDRGPA